MTIDKANYREVKRGDVLKVNRRGRIEYYAILGSISNHDSYMFFNAWRLTRDLRIDSRFKKDYFIADWNDTVEVIGVYEYLLNN